MKKIILLFCITVFGFAGIAQEEDAHLWTGLALKAKVADRINVKYETQLRFFQNASVLRAYYNEATVEYGVIKNLDFSVNYRFSRKRNTGLYTNENRFAFNASYGFKPFDIGLRLKARARYQFSFDRLRVINDVIYPDMANIFRLKIDLRYKNKDFKRVQPFAGYELFKNIQPVHTIAALSAYRLYAGLLFDLPARQTVSLRYTFEREYDNTPKIDHIYLIQYNYSLPSSLFSAKKKKR